MRNWPPSPQSQFFPQRPFQNMNTYAYFIHKLCPQHHNIIILAFSLAALLTGAPVDDRFCCSGHLPPASLLFSSSLLMFSSHFISFDYSAGCWTFVIFFSSTCRRVQHSFLWQQSYQGCWDHGEHRRAFHRFFLGDRLTGKVVVAGYRPFDFFSTLQHQLFR